MRKLCLWLAKHLPSITIPTSEGKPYLTRYYLFGKDCKWGNIYLHHFHCSDTDVGESGSYLLHSHPWWGLSFILAGGYEEERRVSEIWTYVLRKTVRPFTFNYLSPDDCHRVDLLQQDAWSIFICGSRSEKRDWYFWDRETNEKIDWRSKVGAVA